MAGHIISIYLKEQGYNVDALSRREFKHCKNIIQDVTDFESLKEIIYKNEYDCIINAIGILNKSAENNKAEAVLLNSYLPHFLRKITKDSKTKIIHLSTDCVFSGKKGNYKEQDLKDGESFYDRSKSLGEIDNDKDLTFRNSIIGPDLEKNGIGLFNWFMKQNQKINGYNKVFWTGVTTLTLAKAIDNAIQSDLTGLYHLVNNKKISKYNLLKLFNEHFKNNRINIDKVNKPVSDKSLINTRKDFDFKVPDYTIMIKEMKSWIDNHKELYRHYFN